MHHVTRSCTAACVALTLCSAAFGGVSIIPKPVTLKETGGGPFTINAQTAVVHPKSLENEANYLKRALAAPTGFDLKTTTTGGGENQIVLKLGGSLRKEGYSFRSDSKTIIIEGTDAAGVFYGIQTLRELLPPQVYNDKRAGGAEWIVPSVEITDYPRFPWRGLLIDPARHFIAVGDVKRFIDVMALHKFNRLQMHLTDNIGWRVEIKKYPDLTRLASNRDRSRGKGGFYSQDEIRDFVRYAADRHVTIVPEIEMPYHAGAAINAYPRLGINPVRVAEQSIDERWGRLGGLVAPRPETVAFMQDVLGEIVELFPSRFIHIGGDEANLRLWDGDPELQAQMKRLGCKDAHELHSWFIKQMDTHLTQLGRRMVGWDEILQGGLAPGATVMNWRGIQGGITAAKAGHDVVMAPTSHTYFDYRQHPDERGLGRSVITLQDVYTFEPIPQLLDAEESKHVLGGQGQLWGELIPDQKRREFMAYPRACALIEVLWSPQDGRDLRQFLLRMLEHRKRLKAAGVQYRALDPSLVESVTLSAENFDDFACLLEDAPGTVGSTVALGAAAAAAAPDKARLVLACSAENDLCEVLAASRVPCNRVDSAAEAVLADGSLLQHGWQQRWRARTVHYAPHYEAWIWASYLWAYDKTKDPILLRRTRNAIRMTMEAYPDAWRWTNGIQQERGRMLLPLAWLIRVDDKPQHRAWLKRLATDMQRCQDASGAIREELSKLGNGGFRPPRSNAEYGTREASAIQRNGDPMADMPYTCNFTLLSLHEAYAATGDPQYREMADKLAEFFVRIQVQSQAHPELDGTP